MSFEHTKFYVCIVGVRVGSVIGDGLALLGTNDAYICSIVRYARSGKAGIVCRVLSFGSFSKAWKNTVCLLN